MPVTFARSLDTTGTRVDVGTMPYIHIIFHYECAEDWMEFPHVVDTEASEEWLEEHGFDEMEFFDVKVSCGYPKSGGKSTLDSALDDPAI